VIRPGLDGGSFGWFSVRLVALASGRKRQRVVLAAKAELKEHDRVARQSFRQHSVVLVVFDGFELLDLAGPCDVLRSASLLGANPAYRLIIASPDGRPVRSDSGVTVVPDASLAELARSRARSRTGSATAIAIGTLLIVGGLGVREVVTDDELLANLGRLSRRAERTASVCTGALALAAAGLLDGYQATTHWASCDALAADHPTVEVLADRLHVHDRDRWTSAGVTAAIDLALAMVEHDAGAELAHAVAGWLVVFVRRPGGQAQFSAQLRSQPARTPAIVEVQRWLPDHLTEDLAVDRLAERAGMSSRNFARAFRREVGTTPAALIESLRVEAARRLLETADLTVHSVAVAVGFRHAETLHRAFQRRVGTTPDRYRQHFLRRAC
jgi:transcriptional regulator GlxA family with amidase domain